ncbi:MAG: DNA adenine methylase [Nitrospirota bacterium]|nr:DNA adenine methylase [Nitrospirota bacterium]
MQQKLPLSFPKDIDSNVGIVNVATVPKRSPFRYPGGKTWLIPEIRKWLGQGKNKPHLFIDIFAGGGIVGLTVAAEQLSDHTFLVEIDPDVSAVWKTVLSDDAHWLVEKIITCPMSLPFIAEVLSSSPKNTTERAFQTILRNRTSHGGILAPGAGLLKYGENGKGILSRWYPVTLAKRIEEIWKMRERISFFQADAFDIMKQYSGRDDTTFFIDPPYTAPGKSAGRRLYVYNEIDHEALFDAASGFQGDFMMTYDDTEAVKKMALKRGFTVRAIPMKNTHHAKMLELLIGPPKHVL